ncbi:choice-of-anchor D domain-containing protein, partial [candidate division KSB1 bacterium]|nr:choice-of-anchor D domain-containing protein [candidate division KSB1 bacterium]
MNKMTLYIAICFFPLLLFAQDNDGMSAYYPFLGSASDASGNGAFGVPSGGPVLGEDRFGYPDGAYNFDGIDDYIVVLDTQYVDIPDDFSLGFWIKPTDNPTTNTVLLSKHYEPLYNDGTWWVGLTPDMKFIFKGTPYFDYDEMISRNTIPLDNWSHLFFTYNDSTYQWAMYINGEVDTTSYLSLAIDNTDKDLYIGTMINTNPFGLVNHFQGAIDEVRIYQRALAAAEVNALYNASPQFSFTPDSVQFGDVAPGAVLPRQVKIENTGNAELRVDSVQIINDSADVFDTYAPGFTILPGDSEIVQVNFGPTMPGEFSAELKFVSNTSDTSIALSGTGMGPLLSVPVDEINFGFISVNEDSVIAFAIHNSGNDTLNLYYAEILGNDAGDFGLSHGNPIPPAAPEDSVFMEIQFSPQTAGYKTAQLVLFSDAPSSPDSVAIIGEAEGQSQVNVEPETQPVAGDSLNFSVTPPPAFQPDVRILYYRQPGESTWRSVALDSAETDYRGFIPPDSVTYKGIEYYVYLSDGENEITFPAVNPQVSPASVQVAVHSVAAEIKLQPGVYKMFSAPLLPSNANLINLLTDNYGYFEIKHWRLLQWSAQDSGYLEMSDSLEFYLAPGTAFWLITRSGEVFDIENCMSMDLSQPFSYTFNPGWNQIGNPFPFPVATDTIRNADLLEAPVYYNGDQYLYDRTVLNPWDGYFVYNPTEAPVTVEIPPIPAPAGIQKKSLFSEFDLAEEFYIQISAEMSNTLLV